MSDARTLIHDALVWGAPAVGARPFYGWVVVQGRTIAQVGAGPSPPGDFDRMIDGRSHCLLPGLVNAHAHCHSSLTRGSAEGASLDDWLRTIEHEQSILTPEQTYVGALATYAEALLSGTTAIVDMCLHPQSALRAAEEIGIRAVIVPYCADAKPFAPTLRDNEALLASGSRDDGRVRTWVGLHDLESCSDAQVAEGVLLAREFDTGLHLHCAETEMSVARTRKRTGRSPVAHLGFLGALGRRTLLAHCVWTDADDHRRLADAGAHVAHCPHANLKLGSGVAPVLRLQAAGVRVALATDGAKANNRLDMFDVMKFASLVPKGLARDPGVLPPETILHMATRAGAEAIGSSAGVIEAGRPADLVLLDCNAFHLLPLSPATIMTNLVHSARGSDVALAMVDGRILVENGVLVCMDQTEILASLRTTGEKLLHREMQRPSEPF